MSHSQASHAFDPYHTWLGIPPNERPISYYRLLGLEPFESNEAAIEAAVDQRLAFLRTKTLGPQAAFAEKLMGEIAQARLVLLDREKKKSYDAALSAAALAGDVSLHRTTPLTESQSPWVAGPVPMESMPQVGTTRYSRYHRRKRGLSKEQRTVVIALGVSFCSVLGIIAFLASGKWQAGRQNAATPANAEHVAKANRVEGAKDRSKRNSDVGLEPQLPPAGEPAVKRQGPLPNKPLPGEVPPQLVVPRNDKEEASLVPLAAQPQLKAWLDKVKTATVIVEGRRGQGSGFFVTTAEGKPVVVTNAHVVTDNPGITIKLFDGRQISIRQASILDRIDLAILAVDAVDLPQPLELRDALPEVGEKVYAYGAPLGLEGTLTEGIVSAIRRVHEGFMIQTTAPISVGNSGGPLLDEEGRVVGVNTAGVRPDVAHNLNFALGSTEVLPRLKDVKFADLRDEGPLFAEVPPLPPSAPRPLSPATGSSFFLESYQCPDIVVPSGGVFQAGKVRPPENWRKILKDRTAIEARAKGDSMVIFEMILQHITARDYAQPLFYVQYDDNNNMVFAAAFKGGLLDGPMVYFEGDCPKLIVNYREGTRTGSAIEYEQGWPRFYAEFVRNRKQGIMCVFDESFPFWPCWVENWRADSQIESCLIQYHANAKPQVFALPALVNEADLGKARDYQAQLIAFRERLEKWEVSVKQTVVIVYREVREDILRSLASIHSATAREAILARHRARVANAMATIAAANAKFKGSMDRRETIILPPSTKVVLPPKRVPAN